VRAVAGVFFATWKRGLVHRHRFTTYAAARGLIVA